MTNDMKEPEWIHAEFGHDGKRGVFWDAPCDQSIEYIRHDLHLSLVAAAYEDAENVVLETKDIYQFRSFIRSRTPADAQAALEARDKRIREEALREAAEAAERVSRSGRFGREGEPWAGWSQTEYKRYIWAALDVKHAIEAIIEKDKTDE